MQKIVIILLVFCNFSFSREICENLDSYQEIVGNLAIDEQTDYVYVAARYALYKECMDEGDGSSFWSSNGIRVKKCGGLSGSERGYVQFTVFCNVCTSDWINEELELIKKDCYKDCRESNYTCRLPSYPNQWGGSIEKINPNGGSCGAILPGCAESSSSVGEDEQSSSSEVPVSSEAESSSSEEEELESSSSGEIDSSSSNDDDDSDENFSSSSEEEILSSSSSLNGPYGYLEDLEPCPNDDFMRIEGIDNSVLYESYLWTESKKLKLPRYTLKPGIFGEIKIDTYCFPMDEGGKDRFGVVTNIPYVHFIHSPYAFCSDWYGGGSMDNVVNIQSFYVCKGVAYQEYYSRNVVQDIQGCRMLREKEGVRFGIEITENMAKYDTDLQVSDTGLEYDADLFPSNFSLQQLVNDSRVVKAFEYCKERVRQMRGYKLSSSSYRRSSSSSEEKSSSSQTESSSSEKEIASSSSIQINSSSSKTTEVSSSSKETKSSSSVYVEISSSSKSFESSSSKQMSSSSEGNAFVAGADQEYTPGKIYSSGLLNMEPGKCYSLNPERGTQYGWISTNAQDSWWWHEVPCDGSAPAKKVTSAGCIENKRGSNAVYRPEDCFYSGLDNMEPGKCYSLNPERGTQRGWISTNAQDSWWWIETPCEKNGKGLYKRVSGHVGGESDAVLESSQTTRAYYNVLGRKMGRNKAFGVKQPIYIKKIESRDNRN